MLTALLLSASLSHATSRPERVIECTALKGKETVQLRVEEQTFGATLVSGEQIRSPIVAEKVEGKGAKARKVMKFKDGELSFVDNYGCFRDAKATLNGVKLKDVKCRDPFAATCSDGSLDGRPKADK